jgi:hypothetical protein
MSKDYRDKLMDYVEDTLDDFEIHHVFDLNNRKVAERIVADLMATYTIEEKD